MRRRHFFAAGLILIMSLPALTSCRKKTAGDDPTSAFSQRELSRWVSGIATRDGALFLTPDFLPVAKDAGKGPLPSSAESHSAASSPSDFWKLHRRLNFRAVLISAAAPYRPLANALHSSPVWVLTDVSPWGYAYTPVSPRDGISPWLHPSASELAARYPDPLIRSEWIAATSSNLIAIGLLREASDLLGTRAENESAALLEARASLAAAKGRWSEAETLARESLQANERGRAARMILVRALTESGRSSEALEQAGRLVRIREDQESLFLLARAANAAGDRSGEIEALEKLVSLGRRDHQPLGASLTYLGQAYGRAGQRGDAMRALQEALRSPELDDTQREAVRQLLDHLKPEDPAQGT